MVHCTCLTIQTKIVPLLQQLQSLVLIRDKDTIYPLNDSMKQKINKDICENVYTVTILTWTRKAHASLIFLAQNCLFVDTRRQDAIELDDIIVVRYPETTSLMKEMCFSSIWDVEQKSMHAKCRGTERTKRSHAEALTAIQLNQLFSHEMNVLFFFFSFRKVLHVWLGQDSTQMRSQRANPISNDSSNASSGMLCVIQDYH